VSTKYRTVGVLGGMGPAATADFLDQIRRETRALTDQEHVPVIARSVPQIPDRTAYLVGDGADPFPGLAHGAKKLAADDEVAFLAIPCNTAHHWHERLSRAIDKPILHIVKETIATIDRRPGDGPIGILATDGTQKADVYGKWLREAGIPSRVPAVAGQQSVMAGIAAVKAGDLETGRALLKGQAEELLQGGCSRVIMGCTEIPIALNDVAEIRGRCVDATRALARAVVHESGAVLRTAR